MKATETSGRSVEEAVEHALAELGRPREEVDVEVIREAKAGFLGIGRDPATVRVTVKDPSADAAGGRQGTRRRRRRRGRGDGEASPQPAGAERESPDGGDNRGFERHSLMVYEEDLAAFVDAFDQAVDYARRNRRRS